MGLDYGVLILFAESFRHTPGDYWTWTANPPDSSTQRTKAYDWVNDKLKVHMTTPVAAPTETVVLAEAHYAISLILKGNDDAQHAKYSLDAEKLIKDVVFSVITLR